MNSVPLYVCDYRLALLGHVGRIYFNGRCLMPVYRWQAVVLVLFVLGGCNANYVFDDGDYRPLGDPQALYRGQ